MVLKERAELLRKIRIGDLEAIESLVLFVNDIILKIPLESYERYYDNLREEFQSNFNLYKARNLFLYKAVLLLLNDFEFLHFFERDESLANIEKQILEKLKNARIYLNNEFTKRKDEMILIKQVLKIKKGAGEVKNLKIDEETIKFYREYSQFLPENNKQIMNYFLNGMYISLISETKEISLKNTIYKVFNSISVIEKNKDYKGK